MKKYKRNIYKYCRKNEKIDIKHTLCTYILVVATPDNEAMGTVGGGVPQLAPWCTTNSHSKSGGLTIRLFSICSYFTYFTQFLKQLSKLE